MRTAVFWFGPHKVDKCQCKFLFGVEKGTNAVARYKPKRREVEAAPVLRVAAFEKWVVWTPRLLWLTLLVILDVPVCRRERERLSNTQHPPFLC